jgi:small subunit ribosomal protein S20
LANTKSAIKEIRVARARQERNKSIRSETRSSARSAGEMISGEDKEAAAKGVIHPNAAARKKSRMAKKLNKAAAK